MKEVIKNHVEAILGVREPFESQSPYGSVVQHFSGNEKVDGTALCVGCEESK